MDYLVPLQYGEAEFVEKRSRFIGQVWPVETESEAKALVAETKAKYYDARHNCWSYSIRNGGIVRYSDDGEPQGTAGQPILEVFRRGCIENVLCVVTRYFGGVLLGAGGLTRAYGNTAKLALDNAGIAVMQLWTRMEIQCPYNLFERIKKDIDQLGGIVENAQYSVDVTINAIFPKGVAEDFQIRLTDLSAGSISGYITGERYIPTKV